MIDPHQVLVCVFAHPDDESFGPAGTIALHAQASVPVYVLAVTKGERGEYPDEETRKTIARTRAQEMRDGAKILGAHKVTFLNFRDGTLSNANYHRLVDAVARQLERIHEDHPDRQITLLTFEKGGISGHIDHIVVSMVCHYTYERITYVSKLMCYAKQHDQINEEQRMKYFVYMPPGYTQTDIDERYDLTPVWEKKKQAMNCHQSQKKDLERLMARPLKEWNPECFIVMKKK